MSAPETRLDIVRSLLNNVTGDRNPRHSGTTGSGSTQLRRFWNLSRDDFVNAVVYGQRVIVPGNPTESALIKSLKGDPPFNGAFDRMPPGGPYLNDDDIAFIAKWIEDGAPDVDSSIRATY